MQTVVYSHGFGVKADSRGMFTEISLALSDARHILFDYNEILENGDVKVAPLHVQANLLTDKLQSLSGKVTLIAHSQGCLVAGLASLSNISRVILLAPPVNMSMERVIEKLLTKPGAKYTPGGMSALPRNDGTTTFISQEYLDSITSINALALYQNIADHVPTTIVRCTEDEILGKTDLSSIKTASYIDIKSDHNFKGAARPELIALLQKELS